MNSSLLKSVLLLFSVMEASHVFANCPVFVPGNYECKDARNPHWGESRYLTVSGSIANHVVYTLENERLAFNTPGGIRTLSPWSERVELSHVPSKGLVSRSPDYRCLGVGQSRALMAILSPSWPGESATVTYVEGSADRIQVITSYTPSSTAYAPSVRIEECTLVEDNRSISSQSQGRSFTLEELESELLGDLNTQYDDSAESVVIDGENKMVAPHFQADVFVDDHGVAGNNSEDLSGHSGTFTIRNLDEQFFQVEMDGKTIYFPNNRVNVSTFVNRNRN